MSDPLLMFGQGDFVREYPDAAMAEVAARAASRDGGESVAWRLGDIYIVETAQAPEGRAGASRVWASVACRLAYLALGVVLGMAALGAAGGVS